MRPLRFRPEVVDDLASAQLWYEQRRAGLGEEMLRAVERCLERIAATPALFAVVHRDVRRSLVGRFPYAVFFVDEDSAVTVIAILHVRRDPELLARECRR